MKKDIKLLRIIPKFLTEIYEKNFYKYISSLNRSFSFNTRKEKSDLKKEKVLNFIIQKFYDFKEIISVLNPHIDHLRLFIKNFVLKLAK